MVNSQYIFIASTLINIILLIWVCVAIRMTNYTAKHGSLLVLQKIFVILGYLFIVGRGFLPKWLSIIGANMAFGITSFFLVVYVAKVSHRIFSLWYQRGVFLIYIICLYIYTYNYPSVRIRTIIVSVLIIAQTLPTLLYNIKARYKDRTTYMPLYIIYTTYILLHGLKILITYLEPGTFDLFFHSNILSVIMLIQQLVGIAITLIMTSILIFNYNTAQLKQKNRL